MEYENAGNASLDNPFGASMTRHLIDVVEKLMSETPIPESDAPSFPAQIAATTRKKASGKGPYPKFVEAFRQFVHERDEKGRMNRILRRLKWRADSELGKLFCFLRFQGVEGLERWIMRKLSVSHAWKVRAARRRARRFYRQSRRRSRASQTQSQIPPEASR